LQRSGRRWFLARNHPGGEDSRTISNLLRKIPIFQDLTDEDFSKLVKVTVESSVPANTLLFRQGDESNAFYIVKSGKVKIIHNANADGTGGRELAVLKDGDFFGEMGVIEDSPRSASAMVMEDSALLKVKRTDFDNLMALNPAIAMKIMVTITKRYKPDAQMVAQPQAQKPQKVRQTGQIIAVNSITGGCGVTTMVCNLGYELQKVTGGKVVLVDGSIQFGDLPVFLDVIPKLTLYQLAEETEVTMEMLGKGYIHKTNFNVDFVAAPMKPEQADVVTADLMRVVLDVLKRDYDYVLLDTHSLMTEPVLTMLELADQIIYMMTADIPGMKNCRLWMELVKALEFPEEKIKLVINKYDRQLCVPVEAIEQKLSVKACGVLPYDYLNVSDCINKGVLLNVAKPKEPVAEQIALMARRLGKPGEPEGGPPEAGAGGGFFGNLRKRFGLG
jgi:pilus assembly protein CpaE